MRIGYFNRFGRLLKSLIWYNQWMRFLTFIFSVCLFSGVDLFLEATTFVAMTDEDKIKTATRICAVEVAEVKAEPSTRGVRTRAKVMPLECFLDPTDKAFDVVWPGGSLDGSKTTRVMDTPDLQVGSRAVLYLWRRKPTDDFGVVSWRHGVIPLVRSSSSGTYVLARHLQSRPSSLRPSTEKPMSLEAFGAYVKEVRSQP
jgi:hypothetical protein